MVNRMLRRVALVAFAVLACVQPFRAQGTLAPPIYQTITNASGAPISGACIWTYAASTTTPLPTYTNAALTVAWTNPIVADAAGRFVVYLAPGVSYKFVVENACTPPAHATVIRTVDPLVGVGSGITNPTGVLDVVNVRLSLTAGVPVTTTDVLAATTLYATLTGGNRIALYDTPTTSWNLRTTVETAIPVMPGDPGNTNYDVFCYDVAGVPTYETIPWFSFAVRAITLTTKDGVWVLSGDARRRYIGTYRTTAVAGTTEDSAARRLLYNYANRAERDLYKAEATASWVYGAGTIRQVRASAANQVDLVIGIADAVVTASYGVVTANDQASLQFSLFGVGLDSTTAFAPNSLGGITVPGPTANMQVYGASLVRVKPTVGYHYLAMLEKSTGTGTNTWYGTATYPTSAVLTGSLWN